MRSFATFGPGSPGPQSVGSPFFFRWLVVSAISILAMRSAPRAVKVRQVRPCHGLPRGLGQDNQSGCRLTLTGTPLHDEQHELALSLAEGGNFDGQCFEFGQG